MKNITKRNLSIVAIAVGMFAFITVLIVGLYIAVKHTTNHSTFVNPIVTSQATISPTPQAANYYTALQLQQYLSQSGFACPDFHDISDPLNGAIDVGACKADSVVIGIYPNNTDAQQAPTVLYSLTAGRQDVYMVVGTNWTVNCDDQSACVEVQSYTHGNLIRLSAQPDPTPVAS